MGYSLTIVQEKRTSIEQTKVQMEHRRTLENK